jgi:fermentation-respiration switch protein FrsA (DUF1100 family)
MPTQETNAITLGQSFFEEVVKPALAEMFPDALSQAACGRFGWGSECLGMDDAVSRDHHWGPRVDVLLPDALCNAQGDRIMMQVSARFPERYRGFPLEAGHVGVPGLAVEGLGAFLTRMIGCTSAPETAKDWLDLPEEDITHVVNGAVWHDPSGAFTTVREVLDAYYPHDVWVRRIAHWCRYASGMGLYALHRATLRENHQYAQWTFARCVKLSLELGFLLNRTYFPYDKWLFPAFRRLPRIAPQMAPLVEQACAPGVSWRQRHDLCCRMHDLLDEELVASGLVPSHPRFGASTTSGYRLLEYEYYHLLRSLPAEIQARVPRTEQVFFESFTTGYVAALKVDDWQRMLHLEPINENR